MPDERILSAGMAAVDFEAATALEAGVLPCSSGEDQVLRLARVLRPECWSIVAKS